MLSTIGGALNSVMAAFHVFLGYKIQLFSDIAEGSRTLMSMLDVGGTLFIVLFAVASLAFTEDMLSTKLGKLVMMSVILLYAPRAVEEMMLSQHFSVLIVGICTLLSFLYLIIFLLPKQAPLRSDTKQKI